MSLTIDLPITQPRELRYTLDERMEFEKRFRHFGKAGMKELLYEIVFPVKPNPARDNRLEYTRGGDLEAQIALIWMGIRHLNPKVITEPRVQEWIRIATQEEGRDIGTLVALAVRAVGQCGVLGFKFGVDDISEEEPAPKAAETSGAPA